MKKKIIIITILAVLLLGCGPVKENPKEGKIVVEFWQAMGGPLGDALQILVNEFNASQDDIYVNSINMGNYTALSQKLMASMQTGNQPDIAQSFEAWTANFMEGDLIKPIEDLIAEDPNFSQEDMEDIYPVFIKSNTINGKLVSFPFNKSVRVQYYNKDILFVNGYDPNKPPQTWDEYRTMCKALTKDLDGDGKIDQYGASIKISAWKFENLLLQAGGKIMNEDNTKALFNSQAGIDALNFLTALLNEDKSVYLSPGYDGQKDFTASKIAFYEDSSVSMAYMSRTGIDFNMGISAIPIKNEPTNIISGTNIVVFRDEDAEKEKAAWEFVKWFTAAEQTAKWSELTYYMPVRRSAFEQPGLKKRLASNPEIKSVYDQLEYSTFEPQISEWYETRKYLEDQVIEKVVRGILTPKEALDNAAEKVEKMINK